MRKGFILFSSFLLLLSLKAQNGGTALDFGAGGFNAYATSGGSFWTTATSNVTFEAWINWNGSASNGIIINNGNSGVDGYFVYVNSNGDIIAANSGVGGYTYGNADLSPYTWYHIAAVLTSSAGEWELYINGVLESPTATNSSINVPGSVDANGRSAVGSNQSGADLFTGIIDEVRIWIEVRTQAEIQQNMFRELTGAETNLLAYYKLNDASGSIGTDSQTSGTYNLSISGTPRWVTSGAFTGPRKALEFNPVANDGVNLGSSTDLKLQTTTFSVAVWLYRQSEGRQQILNNGVSGSVSESYWLAFGNNSNFASSASLDKTLVFGFDPTQADGNDKIEVRSTSEFPLNKWVHVAGTYDGADLKIYINGVLENTQATTGQPWDNASDLYIARQANRDDIDFDGALDELSIWNKTLSHIEILNLMTGTLSGNETGLIGYWRFDEEVGTTAFDMTSIENHGTIFGLPSVISSAAFNTWIGGTSSSWSEATNWSSGSVPTSTDNIGLTSYTNSNSPSISGSPTVNNFVLGSGVNAILSSGLTVNETLGLTDTDLDLNGQTITLGSDATLVEHSGFTITGTSGSITTTRSLDNISAENVGGLGAEITTSANMGNTTISRTHSEYTKGSNKSILRAFDIAPTNNSDLSATLVFNYDDSELNGLTENDLVLFKSTNSGGDWTNEGGTVNTTENTVELSGIDGFSLWTLAENSNPLPVELTYFEGTATEDGVLLEWQTATEVNNFGFEVERSTPLVSDIPPYEGGKEGRSWEKIGFVQGNGTTNSPKNYEFTDSELPNSESVDYRLKQIDNDGKFTYSKVITVDLSTITNIKDEVVYEFALEQNYPNPFNPSTTIKFTIPSNTKSDDLTCKLVVFSTLGEKISTLINEPLQAGVHEVVFDGSSLSSGIYIYKLTFGNYSAAKKLTVIK
jgi:hypothetical protein